MPPWKLSSEAMSMIARLLCVRRRRGEGLARERNRLQVDVDHFVPVGLGEVDCVRAADDAGVVDQDVERTEV